MVILFMLVIYHHRNPQLHYFHHSKFQKMESYPRCKFQNSNSIIIPTIVSIISIICFPFITKSDIASRPETRDVEVLVTAAAVGLAAFGLRVVAVKLQNALPLGPLEATSQPYPSWNSSGKPAVIVSTWIN